MMVPQPPYKGDEPFVFVSYSHRDKEPVYAEIRWLQDQGINVWYDEGIEVGDEWTETLASAITDCMKFLFFITPNSVASEHCRRELIFANHVEVAVMAVFLEPGELPAGLNLALGNRQIIRKYELAEEDYQNQLYSGLSTGGSPARFDIAPPRSEGLEAGGKARGKAPGKARRGILILPFDNRSQADDIGFICEGIADEIITALSGLGSLRVISRGSAMQIAPQNRNLKSLGKQLNVHYVLQGSVQKAGERLRITAQLPSTRSGELLWASKWDSTTDQVFEIQETIARGVVGALAIQLNERQDAQLSNRPISDVRAYEYYLRARQLIYQYTGEALNQALDYLRRGEDIIGENQYITAAMGYVYWQFHNAGIDPDPEHLKRARRCIDKLFEMDAHSPDAHRLLGLVNMQEKGDIQTSVRHLKIALNSNPNDTDTLLWLPLLYGFAGRVSSGYPLVERLLRLDPLSTLPRILPGFLDMMGGDLDKACIRLLESHELNPGNPITTLAYGQVLAMSGRKEEATAIFNALDEFVPGSAFAALGKFYVCALAGDRDGALAAASDDLKADVSSDLQYSWSMAQCYAQIGATDESLRWLENAIKFGFWNHPLLAENDPLLDPVRQDERFGSLMNNVKEKWVYFEV